MTTTTTDNQENLMRRYLLGDLPEAEQLALEAVFFADANRLEQMQEVETDLVDEYVRGGLSNSEQRQFELHYLTTPDHQERVAFARELLRATNEQALPQTAQPKESFWEKLLATLRAPQFAFGVAMTATLLLLVGGRWMAIQKTSWQQQRNQERIAEQQRIRELVAQIGLQTERNAELNAELARLKKQSSAEPKPTTAQTVFSFVLLSGVRGGEQQTLKLPPGTQQIRLQVKLEADDFPRYRASLRPVDGGQSWAVPSIAKNASTISVTVPASKLRNGDYILTLTGVGATGALEEINRYSFRVAR